MAVFVGRGVHGEGGDGAISPGGLQVAQRELAFEGLVVNSRRAGWSEAGF